MFIVFLSIVYMYAETLINISICKTLQWHINIWDFLKTSTLCNCKKIHKVTLLKLVAYIWFVYINLKSEIQEHNFYTQVKVEKSCLDP